MNKARWLRICCIIIVDARSSGTISTGSRGSLNYGEPRGASVGWNWASYRRLLLRLLTHQFHKLCASVGEIAKPIIAGTPGR
jgi:hypothetical protein